MSPSDSYSEFNPREYLRQYYATEALTGDEVAIFSRLRKHLHDTGRPCATAIDVGCGPTIHHAFALAPHAQSICLADYLPANLAEVRHWLRNAPDAHNWDPLLRGVLELSG